MQIEFRNVSKRFGELVVLNDVSFTIAPGLTTAIIGPSGAGKSVLLKHIVGLIQPDSGQIFVDGIDVTTAKAHDVKALRKRMGMLFQDGALFDSMSTGDNIAFPLVHHGRMTSKERRDRVEACLEMVELPGLYDRPTSALSGGQRKRVALARAIAMEPEAVFFDEPNSGLDPLTSDTIDKLISRMKAQLGITFVVITHDIVSALSISDRIGMLWKGDLIAYETPTELRHNPSPIVSRFLERTLHPPHFGDVETATT